MPLILLPRLVRFQTKFAHPTILFSLFLTVSLARADLLDPLDFTSLGTFNVTNGGHIIDTDALTISQTNGVATNLLFTGVIDNQGGQADSFGPGLAVTNIGPLGIPHIAVFTFDDLALDGTATFTVTGHRALALLSHSNALVNVPLSLNGKPGIVSQFSTFPTSDFRISGGSGGGGGFAGGDLVYNFSGFMKLPQPGVGPGGGPGDIINSSPIAASGSFGSLGAESRSNVTGLVYGNLTGLLQGGSGGGCAWRVDISNDSGETGSGGGGALEISAVGLLKIGPAGVLQANGAGRAQSSPAISGSGSGGGIRLTARQLLLDGSVAADSLGNGGGGRIRLRGLTGQPITTDPASLPLNQLSVTNYTRPSLNAFARVLQGVITIEPARGNVIAGNSHELGSLVSQVATTNQPAVELKLRDIVSEGTLTVPAGGITYPYNIELRGLVAQITGADPLALIAQLSGKGSVTVPINVLAGGSISVSSGNELSFAQPVTNVTGAFINTISGTLTFAGDGNAATDDGLLNYGTLNLINAVVNGDVRSPSNSIVNVAGTATFNGLFKGAASFSGTANLVTFNGGYEPGDSPAAVNFGGSVAFGTGATLTMELGGANAGSQYDQLVVGDTATLGGTLDVVLINGFAPAAGQVFQLFNAAHKLGAFTAVNLPALGAGFAWDNQINANGSVAVIAVPGRPQFGVVTLSYSNLIFNGTGGAANGDYVVLSSTNIATPLMNWLPVTSNLFDAGGNFLFTNPINPAQPQEFYRLRLP